ncbi:hypothetical protein Tco_0912510 [Tanacetum coccineum]
MTSLEDINDPTEAMNATIILFAKAFQLTTPTNNNQRTLSNPCNHQINQPVAQNQQGYNAWQNVRNQVAQNTVQNPGVQNGGNQNGVVVIPGIANQNGTGHIARNCTTRPRRRDVAYLQTQLLIAQKEEAGIQLQAEEFDFMAAAGDLDQIEEEEQYTDLLERIPEPQLVPQNDNNVTSVAPSMVQSGGTVETSSAPNEETRAHQETVYRNLIDQVAQVNMVNRNMRATNAELKSELARYKIQEQRIEIRIKRFRPCTCSTLSQTYFIIRSENGLRLPESLISQASSTETTKFVEKHDPLVVYDSEETLKLAQASREKMRFLKKEIKPANYAKINHLLGVFVPQMTKFKEELLLSNVSNMVTVSKTISIPNEDLSDDTTPSVAQKFLNEEADESLDKQKYLELEIERLLKASVSHDIMSTMQNSFVDVPSNLQTEIDRTNEKLENCIIKKENEYAKLWNDWHRKCEECKYNKILYDKCYKDMQCQIKRLQAQLGDLKGKRSITPSASNTLDPLNQKLETKIVELEFQVVNYEREIRHLKTTYMNLFDSIISNRANAKLHNLIYENAKLRAHIFENTSDSMNNTSGTSVTPQVDKPKLSVVTPFPKKLHASILSHSVPQPKELNVVKHSNVIAPGMFKIDPSQTSRVDLVPNNQSSASIRTNSITNSQHHVTSKENVSSDMVNSSSTGLAHTARTRRPQPKGNTRNDRVPSASKSSKAKKNVIVEDHRRNLSLSKNQKTMSSECSNIKLVIRNDNSEIVCGTCKQCFVTANHDACLPSFVNALNSHTNNLCAVQIKRDIGHRLFKFFLGTVCFGNDRIAVILGYGDLKWGNITIARVYFVEGLGHNLFSVGQFCDDDLEVAFRRNTCFIRDMDGVDLLKGNRTTNIYTINLYDMASASPICLMARATCNTPKIMTTQWNTTWGATS